MTCNKFNYNWSTPDATIGKINELENEIKNIADVIYPIGSIYMSMNNINPSIIFGGTWTQINDDRFLLCSSSSKQTGGSKKISVDQLPEHDHRIYCTALPDSGGPGIRRTWYADGDGYTAFDTGINTGSTGTGQDYLPPYITIFAWYRVA